VQGEEKASILKSDLRSSRDSPDRGVGEGKETGLGGICLTGAEALLNGEKYLS